MTKAYIETQRYTSRTRFIAHCKKLMIERGYADWLESFEGLLEEAQEIRSGEREAYSHNNFLHDPNVAGGMSGKEIWGQEFNEINANNGYDFQMYYKHDTDGTAYNMNFEHDGECGYFYMIDAAIQPTR